MSRLAKFCVAMILGCGLTAGAQSVAISGQVNYNGNAVPFAPIQVCKITSTGTPCFPTAAIFYDYNLSLPAPNPTSADQFGNYTYYAAPLATPSFYEVQVTPAPGIVWSYVENGGQNNGGPFLLLAGGTLIGPLFGTSASFSGIIASSTSLSAPILTLSGSGCGAGTYAKADGSGCGSGGGTWGSITGTLSSQTDLQTALDAKLPLAGGTLTGPLTFTGVGTASTTLSNLGGLPINNPTFTGAETGPQLKLGSQPLTVTIASMLQGSVNAGGGDGYNIQNVGLGTFSVIIGSFENSATNFSGTNHNYFGCGLTGVNFLPSNFYIAPANSGFCQGVDVDSWFGSATNNATHFRANNVEMVRIDSTSLKLLYLTPSANPLCYTVGGITNMGCSGGGGGSGVVNAGNLYEQAYYPAAGIAVSGVTPLHVNAKMIGAAIDGITDDTTVINNWLAANSGRILDIPYDGNPAHYALITAPLIIGTRGAGLQGSGPENIAVATNVPNIDLIKISYTSGVNSEMASVQNMGLSYLGPIASGFTATATISGTQITGFAVGSGGTNYNATPGIHVVGCQDVHTIATFSGTSIATLSPASGSPALGTLVSSGATGTCIPLTQTWTAATFEPRYHDIVVNIAGTNQLFSSDSGTANITGGSAPAWVTTTPGVSTTTDNTTTWRYLGVWGTVTVDGGSTGDPTGQATKGFCINAVALSPGAYDGALMNINNVKCTSTGGGVKFNNSEVGRMSNVFTSSLQDANSYGLSYSGGGNQSPNIAGFTTSGAGWCGYIGGGQGYFQLGDCGGAFSAGGWDIKCQGCYVQANDLEGIQAPVFTIEPNTSVKIGPFFDLHGPTASTVSSVVVLGQANVDFDLATTIRNGQDFSIPFCNNTIGMAMITGTNNRGVLTAASTTAGLVDTGAVLCSDIHGVPFTISPIPVRDSAHPVNALSFGNIPLSIYWINAANNTLTPSLMVTAPVAGVGTQADLWEMLYKYSALKGTPASYTPVAGATCAPSAGYTNTNGSGEITIVSTSATTGTLCTVAFSSTLPFTPKVRITQNGGATMFSVGHGTASASSFTVTSGITVVGQTVNLDYEVTP